MTLSFRTRLIVIIAGSVAASVAAVALLVGFAARRGFEETNEQRSAALATQFRQEFDSSSQAVMESIREVASGEQVQRIAIDASRSADLSPYVNNAGELAAARHLDFLEIAQEDGTIVSSAHWPARFGYKETWLAADPPSGATAKPATIRTMETPAGTSLALISAQRVGSLFVAGGKRLDAKFLHALSLPAEMRVLLYSYADGTLQSSADAADASKLLPLTQRLKETSGSGEIRDELQGTDDAASRESVQAVPLKDERGQLIAALIMTQSQGMQIQLERRIRNTALLVAGLGIILAVILGWLLARRISEPVEELADVAREVAAGNWDARAYMSSQDEIGRLGAAFNSMTQELSAQQARLVQSERVAAWRELARRLAHELKNPLFPLQITVENLLRAKKDAPQLFDEVFQESTQTMLAEISNLKAIVGRFSDFSKMPAPQLEPVQMNDLVRSVLQLFQGQLGTRITTDVQLQEPLATISADPVLLRRAIENLLLNAMDAMPNGGKLNLRTSSNSGSVAFEITDSGEGLTPEECERIFTPYYTTKQHGTGLGLAIVQSVVSDHGGRITVSSSKQQGTTFRIEFPAGAQVVSSLQSGVGAQ